MVKNVINVLSYNVRGLRSYDKRRQIISRLLYDIHDNRPDIIFFQETHSTKRDIKRWQQEFQFDLVCAHNSTAAGGLLIGFRRGLDCHIRSVIREKQFLLVNCIIAGEEYTLVNVHALHEGNYDALSKFFQEIWSAVGNNPTFKVLIGGDFNAITDPDLDIQDVDKAKHRQYSLKAFQTFLEESGMTDVWRSFNPTIKRFTRRLQEQTPARIDRFLVSDLLFNYSYDVDIGLSFKSDHSPIYYSFYSNRNATGKNLFRFPNFLLADDVFKQFLANEIQQFIRINLNEVDLEDKPSPSLLWDTLKAFIRACTIDYLKKLKKDKAAQVRLRTEAYDRTIWLEKERDKCYQDSNKVSEVSKQLQEAHARLQEIITLQGQKKLSANTKRKRIFSNTCSKYFF